MAQKLTELQKEIAKARRHLSTLESRVRRMKKTSQESEEQRLVQVEKQFRMRYPDLRVRRELLALVGTEPYNPVSRDKGITRQIVAERYGG